jgi:deazaflavin-dependent oxidoreductase (nitroreductase family)
MKASDRATRRRKFLDLIRQFNKYIFNRIILTFAEGRMGPFSVIYHQGRRSGRTYRTPVLASFIGETIIIPLTYGEQVDWLKNVLAHAGCEVVRRKRRMAATNPEVIGAATALPSLPEKRQELFRRYDIEKFLRLKQQFVE